MVDKAAMTVQKKISPDLDITVLCVLHHCHLKPQTSPVCSMIATENSKEVTNSSATPIPPSHHNSWRENKATLIVSIPVVSPKQ